jgi:glutamate synthase (NADPH/NADH) small chain
MNMAMREAIDPLTSVAALREAHRCLNCYDAPCTHARPTHIDIPGFIKKIATGNFLGSAQTIFDANLLGATCDSLTTPDQKFARFNGALWQCAPSVQR